MKLFILLLIILSFNVNSQVPKGTQLKETESIRDFNKELKTFIDKVNKEYYKIKEYFVFVIHVYQSDSNCNAYTIGFIFNEKDFNRIVPHYQIFDSSNIIL